jgi:hypothetical protein
VVATLDHFHNVHSRPAASPYLHGLMDRQIVDYLDDSSLHPQNKYWLLAAYRSFITVVPAMGSKYL